MFRSTGTTNPSEDGEGLAKGGPEPIAIVGIGCRFPGADGLEAFWSLMKDGVDAVGEMPPGRFDLDAVYDPSPRTRGKIVTRQGGFLSNVDRFDPDFFGIPAREAHFIDPQQRLLLEVSWEAFEDAGIPRERFAGSRTGVFVGMWTNEYEQCMYRASDIDLYVTTGGGRYSASGRLSYVFDLQGPSLTVDTACSSSLVAVHLACQSLWSGESALALAGGVNLILQPHITIGYSRSGVLSPDGRCKFADARANGYVRSEGVGMVLLKPVSRAVEDGDPIYALIRGGAVNNDGRSGGLLVAPGSDGQEAMLRAAYRQAGVSPGMVQYMEAHGTGTRVGDPVELKALGSVLSEDRPVDQRCVIGSVKTNIGHSEAASGIAGLIKVALCLKHRAIPPSLHFQEPNPRIPWDELPLVVPRQLQEWPAGPAPALAAVNSFGITGTNAHIILQEGPPSSRNRESAPESVESLFVLSARSPEALTAKALSLLERGSGGIGLPPLRDLCYTSGARRTHHEHRLAVVVRDGADLLDHMGALVRGQPRRRGSVGRVEADRPVEVVFVFSGQGSQWLGMGRELREREATFREALDRCDLAVRAEAGWSPVDELAADRGRARLDEIDVAQPVLFAIQVALAAQWRSWGVEPRAVVGDGMGEVAAAHVAGVLGLEDAVRVVCRRSRLVRRAQDRGALASNELRADLVRALEGLRPLSGSLPLYSTATGRAVVGSDMDAPYWARILAEPVLLSSAIQRLVRDGHPAFVEVSPHPILLSAIRQELKGLGRQAAVLPSLRREEGERASMLESLGTLYTMGYSLDWSALHPAGGLCVRLFSYPWQRGRFWFDEPSATAGSDVARARPPQRVGPHPTGPVAVGISAAPRT